MKLFILTALLCLLLVKLSNCQQKPVSPNPDDVVYKSGCSINETVPEECTLPCGPTCQNRNPGNQPCSFTCAPCICKPNFLRDEVTGNCILEKDCPVPITEESPCPENSIVIDPCAAQECSLHYHHTPIKYAQDDVTEADIAQEVKFKVKQSIKNDLSIIRPLCHCIPECQCLPNYVMYYQKCVLRKIKPNTGRPIIIHSLRPEPISTIEPVSQEEHLPQEVASESRQHHERKHNNREKQHDGNKKRHHSEKHNNKNN